MEQLETHVTWEEGGSAPCGTPELPVEDDVFIWYIMAYGDGRFDDPLFGRAAKAKRLIHSTNAHRRLSMKPFVRWWWAYAVKPYEPFVEKTDE